MSLAKRESAMAGSRGQRGGPRQGAKQSRLTRCCCVGPALLLFLMVFASSRCTTSGIADFPSAAAGLGPLIPCEATAPDTALVRQGDTDPVSLLEKGIRWYDGNLRDYEGTFVVQEIEDGRSRISAVCSFKFRQSPFSVAMRWVEGAGRIDKLLYVEGKHDGQMSVHPTGFIGRLFPAAAVDPHGGRATKGGLRPITQFGLRNTLERVLGSFRKDVDQGTLRARCLGVGKLNGRRVLTLEQTGPEGKLIVELATETLLPARVRLYGRSGRLSSLYEYSQLRFNRGFSDATFTREANGL